MWTVISHNKSTTKLQQNLQQNLDHFGDSSLIFNDNLMIRQPFDREFDAESNGFGQIGK